jgi:hypothetical protein
MSSIYKPPQGKGTLVGSALFGLAMSVLIFVGFALSQIFTASPKPTDDVEALAIAPLSLDMLDIALEPGTGESMAGNFALPSFDVNQKDLGDVDSPPKPKTQVEFKKPAKAKRIKGVVRIEYIVSEKGTVKALPSKSLLPIS